MKAPPSLEGPYSKYRDFLRSLRALCCGPAQPKMIRELLVRYAEAMAGILPARKAGPQVRRRTKLWRSADFELLMLEWGAGAATEIHDHDDQHCTVVVIDGSIAIDDYHLDSVAGDGAVGLHQTGALVGLGPGATDYRQHSADLHAVRSANGATTLHVYAGPIEKYFAYDPEKRSRYIVSPGYDAVGFSLSEAAARIK